MERSVGVLRALGVTEMINFLPDDWDDALGARFFEQQLEMLGQKLFEFSAPTGLPDVRFAWWNSNQVFGRWSLANALMSRYYGDQTAVDVAPVSAALDAFIAAPATATQVIDRLLDAYLGRAIDAADRSALIDYLGAGNAQAAITLSAGDLPRITAISASVRRGSGCMRAMEMIAS